MSDSARVSLNLAGMRREHGDGGLYESNVEGNPFDQFAAWFAEALEAEVIEPNAMTVATATPDGKPSARIVLLKGVDEHGFVFYTNYESRKGSEIAENPYVALLFHWPKLTRQVRITGVASRVPREQSAAYFHSRPAGSQLGAWASHQSRVIPNREVLDQRLSELREEYAEREIPLPSFWGGFRVVPETIEFWQGRPNRLHDRLRYSRQPDGGWRIERLSP